MRRAQRKRGYRGGIAIAAIVALALVLLLVLTIHDSSALMVRKSANPGNLFSSGALTLTNTKDGAVVVSAAGLMPGGSANGSLTVSTSGNYSAAVTLGGTTDGSALSQALTLKVEDTTGTATTLWSGAMSAFPGLGLGTFTSGTTKSYRFTVALPVANATAGIMGVSTTMTLRFTGVGQ
jgi:hypothetical protein